MKFVVVGLVAGLLFAGLGCSDGLTEDQVVDLIRERDTEVKRQTQQAVETIQGNLAEWDAQLGQDLIDLHEAITAASAEDIVELRQYVDGEVSSLESQMADGFLAQRQYMVNQVLGVEQFMNDAEANIREVARAEGDSNFAEVQRVAKETLEAVQQTTDTLVRSICEADYWAMTALSMAYALSGHLGGDGTTLEDIELFLYGIIIGDDYGDVSSVCRVDADGRWVLNKQPDKIIPDRRG